MRVFGRALRVAVMVVGFLAASLGISTGQKPVGGTASQAGSHQTGGTMPAAMGTSSPLDGFTSPFPDNGRQKRNDERQRRIVSDTEKLLALTSQLKSEIASSGVDSMTPEMLKQVDEIEKLAKSVKDRMRD